MEIATSRGGFDTKCAKGAAHKSAFPANWAPIQRLGSLHRGRDAAATGAWRRRPHWGRAVDKAHNSGGRQAAAPLHHTSRMSWFFSGTERMRLPVALKYALSTAGAATKIVGSPTPPQKPPDGMMIDSTFGIWAIRIES